MNERNNTKDLNWNKYIKMYYTYLFNKNIKKIVTNINK